MEVAIGLMSLALAILGVILVYIYRTNGRYMRALLDGQREMQNGLKEIQAGQREIAEGIKATHREIQNGLKELQAGQREIATGIKEVARIARDIHEGMERIAGGLK